MHIYIYVFLILKGIRIDLKLGLLSFIWEEMSVKMSERIQIRHKEDDLREKLDYCLKKWLNSLRKDDLKISFWVSLSDCVVMMTNGDGFSKPLLGKFNHEYSYQTIYENTGEGLGPPLHQRAVVSLKEACTSNFSEVFIMKGWVLKFYTV